MTKFKNTLLLVIISTFSIAQTSTIKYMGNSDENILLTDVVIKSLTSPAVLNKNHRELVIESNSPTTLLCNQITRNTQIFVLPNETIEFDLNNRGLINYYCKTNPYRKLESEFINDCFEKYGATENISNYNELKQIRLLNKTEKYFDKEYKKEQELLKNYYKEGKVSNEFYQYFTAMYWCLIQYNNLESNILTSETYTAIEKSFDEADVLINVEGYKELLQNYVTKSIKKAGIKNDFYTKMEFITTNFKNQEIIDYLLYSNINYALNDKTSKIAVGKQTIDLFRENCKNQDYLDAINQDLQQKTTPIILESIIKKHKGKLVFVDFWASWCMPCREEFPSEKRLMQKYPNVAFVFLSIDKSSSAWQKAMAEYDDILNKENSFLLIKSNKDELLKQINLSTIPRFVLFGKDGKIINIDAPRPSTKELEALIERNL